LLERLIHFAFRRNMPVAMHLAESREEMEFLQSGTGPFQELLAERSMWDTAAVPRGTRAADYLALLAQSPRALVIHGNYLNSAEQETLYVCENLSLVYCPRTHAFFQHDEYPLAELLERGVRVVLGTDSRASNPDLSVLAEIRFVLENHRGVSPEQVLRMATHDAAAAFGWDEEIGSLAVGKRADLVALPLAARRADSAEAALEGALHFANRPTAVWLGGRECDVAAV
jgi:cytosine/adenosine deaminase-related metal-dependent hydrolase